MSVSQDSKNLGIILWIGTLFFGFIPALILFLVKSDDAFIKEQSKEALNWSITWLIVAAIVYVVKILAVLLTVVYICNIIFCIMGIISVYNGNNYRVPFAIRLLK